MFSGWNLRKFIGRRICTPWPNKWEEEIAGDDVKIPEENVIDGKPATEFLGRGGTEICLSNVSKEPTVGNNHISTENKTKLILNITKEDK